MIFFCRKVLITTFITILTFMIGIIIHEVIHGVTAYYLGYQNIKISYNYVAMTSPHIDTLNHITKLRKTEILNQQDYPEKEYYRQTAQVPRFYVNLSSNLFIFIVGTLALLALHLKPSFLKFDSIISFFIFYSSLFLGQFISDGLVVAYNFLFGLSISTDLITCAYLLKLPKYSLLILVFLLSSLLLSYLFFSLIPAPNRPYLIIGVATGTIIGRIIWFKYLGHLILP
jgi:hypothetical protein